MIDFILDILQGVIDIAAEKEGIEKPKPQNPRTDYEADQMMIKNRADRMFEARQAIERETDPVKKAKMQNRLSFGVTDFSDL